MVLALVLSGVLASRLSRQITKPINNIDLENPRLDDAYEELFPLVGRLREQNRTISRQMEALSRRQREFAALAENMSEGVLLLDSRYNEQYGGAVWNDRIPLAVRSTIDENTDANVWRGRSRWNATFNDWRFAAIGGISTGEELPD